MQKKDKKAPEDVARDLEDVVLPEISEEVLEDTYGSSREIIENSGCTGCP